MLRRFCTYIVKVFDFDEEVFKIRDSREKPDISTSTIWVSGVLMCALRLGSLNAMETELRIPQRMEKFVGKRKTSADSIGRVYSVMDLDPLRDVIGNAAYRLKRNKVLQTDWPFRFAAVDGHELFTSRSRCCSECCSRRITINGEEVTEYYHRVVVCHLIGFKIPLPLDVEPVLPGEGEVNAAKRLLERVFCKYPRFFDVVVGDALYMEAPFINFCLLHKKHVITILKEDRLILMQDAKGIFNMTKPEIFTEGDETVKVWDAEGFTSAGTDKPLRVVYAQETERKRRRVKGEWVETVNKHQWYWASTIPEEELSVRRFWKAAHGRWEIENNIFNVLVKHWYMDHCYKHEPNAIIAFLLTLFLSFIFVQSFYHLNLKKPIRDRFAIIAITRQLYGNLGQASFIVPWGTAPP
ncbi:MAG: transposase [Patescibacteria group bacterium]|nr:transposase [Patescibacteria group bacterium]